MSDSDSTNNSEASLVPRQPESPEIVRAVFAPPHYPGAGPAAREPHLRDYLIILRKHQWLILSVLLAVVTIVTIASFKMRPVYVAVARVEIDRENSYILPFRDVMPQESYVDMDNYIETRAKILQSETLALMTIRSLKLEKQPEFAPAPEKGRARASQIPGEADPREKPKVLDDFLDRLGVRRVRNSRLLEVQFEAHDPKLAAKVVNSHLANFVEHNFQTRYDSTVQASNWLATQLDELKIKVEKSEDSVVAYERENQIWAIDEKQNITTQKLSDLNRELTLAQTDRMRKQASYSLARSGKVDAIPAVRDSNIIQNLLGKRAELNSQHAEARAQFGPNYPKVVRLEAQLKEQARLLQQEKQNIVGRIGSEYWAARRREALLSQALESQKTKANLLAQKLVQYNILKREAETNKQLHECLLQRSKEAGVSARLRS
ncbi:MAG: GumC family protein, partial [Acidobacteria bacterium]|nr:GumC family protein [Acidobacteriota bacterium]